VRCDWPHVPRGTRLDTPRIPAYKRGA